MTYSTTLTKTRSVAFTPMIPSYRVKLQLRLIVTYYNGFPNGIATANGIATTLHSEILSLASTERGWNELLLVWREPIAALYLVTCITWTFILRITRQRVNSTPFFQSYTLYSIHNTLYSIYYTIHYTVYSIQLVTGINMRDGGHFNPRYYTVNSIV